MHYEKEKMNQMIKVSSPVETSTKENEKEINPLCVICQERNKNSCTLNCQHTVCLYCYTRMIYQNVRNQHDLKCPICRQNPCDVSYVNYEDESESDESESEDESESDESESEDEESEDESEDEEDEDEDDIDYELNFVIKGKKTRGYIANPDYSHIITINNIDYVPTSLVSNFTPEEIKEYQQMSLHDTRSFPQLLAKANFEQVLRELVYEEDEDEDEDVETYWSSLSSQDEEEEDGEQKEEEEELPAIQEPVEEEQVSSFQESKTNEEEEEEEEEERMELLSNSGFWISQILFDYIIDVIVRVLNQFH